MSPFHRLFLDVLREIWVKRANGYNSVGWEKNGGWEGRSEERRRQQKARVKGFIPLLVPGD